jgi:DNA-binding transcriptional ArsR family regulator
MEKTMIEEMAEKSMEVASILKTLGHPKRLLILCTLSEGEKSVSDIEEVCQASQSQVSQFLKRMENEGLLYSQRNGNHIFYSIKDERILKLINNLSNIFCN